MQFKLISGVAAEIKSSRDPLQQFTEGWMRIGNQPNANIVVETIEQFANQSGFTGADFSTDDAESGLIENR